MNTQQARQKSPGKYEWEPAKDAIIYSSSGSQNREKGMRNGHLQFETSIRFSHWFSLQRRLPPLKFSYSLENCC